MSDLTYVLSDIHLTHVANGQTAGLAEGAGHDAAILCRGTPGGRVSTQAASKGREARDAFELEVFALRKRIADLEVAGIV